jgi:hypothetical protein
MSTTHLCPNCGSTDVSNFYEVKQVPVHSVLLLSSREEALKYPKRDIVLGFCQKCGFIFNIIFDSEVHEYSSNYDPTQSFSSTFNSFHRKLAAELIERHDLHNKSIIEIGCGQGEFLALLCEMGNNKGIGFDPAYVGEHKLDGLTFIKDFYSETYAHYRSDFICCKMTLEHIPQTYNFVTTVRRSIGNHAGTVVFFQVPDMRRILRELAFWDIYYEHCSYFSKEPLVNLFRWSGFKVLNVYTAYDDQYLMIEAKPVPGPAQLDLAGRLNDLEQLKQELTHFIQNYPRQLELWRQQLQAIKQQGQRAVIWGAGSKGVTFLTTLKVEDEIGYAVDVNPRKHGTYMAGSGHEIVGPDFLREYRPDVVIVMNPIYCNEIQQDLNKMGLVARLIPV